MLRTLSKLRLIDFIPAFSGLIGKTALVTSFALVWAQELNIENAGFVFENVRLEIMIASIITLIIAFLLPKASPAGTLSPLIILIPVMVGFGVHPLILSVEVGILGIVAVKTGIFGKLIGLSGNISKSSLSLVFGVSGIVLSIEKLISFFRNKYMPLIILLIFLIAIYIVLFIYKKAWVIIPTAAVASIFIPLLFGIEPDLAGASAPLNFNPYYWWNDMWGIGFGLNAVTLLKTLPFALFVIVLWAVDTVSVKAITDNNSGDNEKQTDIDMNNSFLIVSARNAAGGLCGGAQTAALWRSFLIPLSMVKRPIQYSAILLGILGITASITAVPIRIMSYPPLIWTVLLFGIFVPFLNIGLKGIKNSDGYMRKGAITLLTAIGLLFNPIITWVGAVVFEKTSFKKNRRN